MGTGQHSKVKQCHVEESSEQQQVDGVYNQRILTLDRWADEQTFLGEPDGGTRLPWR